MKPIIILGPARSGTKILRDTIASHPDVSSIAFDINFIWKKYNEDITHDQLHSEHASSMVKLFIQDYFRSKQGDCDYLVEKTVSNTLRIPFVKEVFPDAKFIYLYRDGRDVVESVLRQWGTAPSKKYLLQKFLSIPFLKVAPYLYDYGKELILIKSGLKTSDDYVWGVKYQGFENDLGRISIEEFCAKQWNACINHMLDHYDPNCENSMKIKYEDMATEKDITFEGLGDFLNLNFDSFDTSKISSKSVFQYKRNIKNEDLTPIMDIIKDNLIRLEYEC